MAAQPEREPDEELPAAARSSIWEELLAADDTAVDVERLAAYAEGRLSAAEREEIRRLIARSPVAMELLDTLCDQGAPAAAARARPAPVVTARPARVFGGSPTWTLALAASLLFAVAASYVAYDRWHVARDLQTQVAQLGQEVRQGRSDLALARKEQVVLLSGRSPLMVGRMTPRLTELALADGPASRSLPELPPEEQQRRAEQLRGLIAQAAEALPPTVTDELERLIENASLPLAAGDGAAALAIIQPAAERFGRDARFRTARAAALVTLPDDTPLDAVQAALQKAEEILRQVTAESPGFAPAWFNLALIDERLAVMADVPAEQQQKREDAAAAWRQYLQSETDAAFRAAVRAARAAVRSGAEASPQRGRPTGPD